MQCNPNAILKLSKEWANQGRYDLAKEAISFCIIDAKTKEESGAVIEAIAHVTRVMLGE